MSRIDLGSISQYSCIVLSWMWVIFSALCWAQVSRRARWMPRYLTLLCSGTVTPLILMDGQFPLLSVNIMSWTHLKTLTYLPFLQPISLIWDWSLCDATVESVWILKNAVSSTKVDVWITTLVGISVVNNKYRNVHRILHWGTPADIFLREEVASFDCIWKYVFHK